jgi:hypothetical protein
MAMTPQLLTLEAIAVETGKDRRTIGRLLRDINPDGMVKGRPAWRLKTVLRLLDRRNGSSAPLEGSAELTDLAQKIQDGFERARGIVDLAERRAFLKKLGPSVGELDRGLSAMNPDDEWAPTILQDHIVRETIAEFLALMEMKFVPEPEQPSA